MPGTRIDEGNGVDETMSGTRVNERMPGTKVDEGNGVDETMPAPELQAQACTCTGQLLGEKEEQAHARHVQLF